MPLRKQTRYLARLTRPLWVRDRGPYSRGAVAGTFRRRLDALDSWEQSTQTTFGNGLVATAGTLPATGQLAWTCVGAGLGQCGQLDLGYSHDGRSNVIQHTQSMPLATESFIYDQLHRLMSGQRNGAAAVTLGYHANGNLRYKSGYSQVTPKA